MMLTSTLPAAQHRPSSFRFAGEAAPVNPFAQYHQPPSEDTPRRTTEIPVGRTLSGAKAATKQALWTTAWGIVAFHTTWLCCGIGSLPFWGLAANSAFKAARDFRKGFAAT
jgi:hypothetical protein